jgi:hypothetical protein
MGLVSFKQIDLHIKGTKMRYKFLAILFAGLAIWHYGSFALADESRPAVQAGQPLAEMDSNHHAFDMVLEGEKVEHTFTIRNKGDEELVIERIYTG